MHKPDAEIQLLAWVHMPTSRRSQLCMPCSGCLVSAAGTMQPRELGLRTYLWPKVIAPKVHLLKGAVAGQGLQDGAGSISLHVCVEQHLRTAVLRVMVTGSRAITARGAILTRHVAQKTMAACLHFYLL